MFLLQATYDFNENFDVTHIRPTMETTLVHTPYIRSDNLIIIQSIQTPGV